MGKPTSKKKEILVTNIVKEEFTRVGLHGGGGLDLTSIRGYPEVKKN